MHKEKSTCGASAASGSKHEAPKSANLGISSSDKKSTMIHLNIEDIKSPSSKDTVPKRQSPRNMTSQQKSNVTSTSKASNEKISTMDVDVSITKSKDCLPSEKNVESHSIHIGLNDSMQSDNIGNKKRFSSIEELASFQKLQKKSNLSIVPEGNVAPQHHSNH